MKPDLEIRVGILTVSDRSFQGKRADASGPVLSQMVQAQGWQVVRSAIVPDEVRQIRNVLIEWADGDEADVILTTGGTGFAPRDITPEATMQVIHREAPGLAEAMRIASIRVTPHAMLSRAVAGIRGQCIIVNLPGSPKAAKENLQVVLDVLPHAVQLVRQDAHAEQSHHFEL